MQITIYIFIYMLAILLAMDNRIIPNRFFFVIWFIVMACLSLTMRWEGVENADPNSDLGTYAMNMAITDYILPYHWREPIFWLGSRYLYQVIGDLGLVFFVMDIVLFISFYKGVTLCHQTIFNRNTELGTVKYLYFGAFLFIPYANSMEGTYRQILATAIFMMSLGYANSNKVRSLIIYAIALLIHNGLVLLLPAIILAMRGGYRLILATTILVLTFYSKNVSQDIVGAVINRDYDLIIGKTIHILYLGILVFIYIAALSIEGFKIGSNNILFFKIMLMLIGVYMGLMFIMESKLLERSFMLFISILFPLGGIYLDHKLNPKYLVRLAFLHATLFPWIYYS